MSTKIQWEIPAISREHKTLFHRQSNQTAAWHLLIRLISLWSIFVFQLVTLFEEMYFLFGIFVLINGLQVTFLGWAGAGHEYFHGTAFKSKKLNRILFRVFSCITWNNWGWFEVSHQLHHKWTLHTLDPESPGKSERGITSFKLFCLISIDVPVLLRRFRVLFLNSLGIVPGAADSMKNFLYLKPRFIQKIRLGALSVWLYQVLTLCILWQFSPIVAVLNSVSAFTFTFVNKIVETNQHIGMKYHATDFRENSRTIRFNRILEHLYSNMNFHSEHHMFPGIPYYKLPNLNAHLIQLGVVAKPKKGLVAATKIVLASREDIDKSRDCLSCFAKCPLAPTETLVDK